MAPRDLRPDIWVSLAIPWFAALISICLRIWARRLTKVSWWFDDYFAILGFVSAMCLIRHDGVHTDYPHSSLRQDTPGSWSNVLSPTLREQFSKMLMILTQGHSTRIWVCTYPKVCRKQSAKPSSSSRDFSATSIRFATPHQSRAPRLRFFACIGESLNFRPSGSQFWSC